MNAIESIARGHWLLVACAVLYLFWWVVFFRPNAAVHGPLRVVGIAAILVAAVCGIWGIALAGGALPRLDSGVPLWAFAVGGVVAYVVLLAATSGIFHRQVTTELLLIVAWGAFESCVVAVLRAANAKDVATGPSEGVAGGSDALGVPAVSAGLTVTAAALITLLIVVLLAGSLVCYVLYYRLPPWPAFIDGCIPLAAVGIEAAVLAVLIG